MKKKIISYFGDGSVAQTARVLNMSPQRIRAWHEHMTRNEINGVIAESVRKNHSLPESQKVKLISTLIPSWMLK